MLAKPTAFPPPLQYDRVGDNAQVRANSCIKMREMHAQESTVFGQE